MVGFKSESPAGVNRNSNTTADRQLLELMVATQAIPLPFAMPPGVPPERLETLRQTFDVTMKDPEFLAEARKILSDSDPSSGEETKKYHETLPDTPQGG